MTRLCVGLISYFCLAFLLAVAQPVSALAAANEQRLRVLTWPGYADADVVKVFEQRTDSKVEVTVVDSDAVLWQKVAQDTKADEAFDVIAVNTAELQRYIRAGLVLPIAAESLPNLASQLPRFRDLRAIPGLVQGDEVYGIPYAYAEMGLIYDRQQVAEAPDSIAALWDERYRGKVLAFNDGTHNVSLAAQSLGLQLDEGRTLYHAVGCPACRNTGYRGRLAIHELLLLTDDVKRMVLERGSALSREQARYVGGNLLQDGATKVLEGLTTAEEVLRVARQDD